MDESLMKIVRANVREPVQVEGDFHALDRLQRHGRTAALGDDAGIRHRRPR